MLNFNVNTFEEANALLNKDIAKFKDCLNDSEREEERDRIGDRIDELKLIHRLFYKAGYIKYIAERTGMTNETVALLLLSCTIEEIDS